MVPRRNTRARASKLCRNYALGCCPQGDRCKYLHVVLPSSSALQPALGSAQPNATQLLPQRPPPFPSQWYSMEPRPFELSLTTQAWAPSPTVPTNPDASVPPPNAPQYRQLSWRTALCRHFSRNHGWCPLDDDCNYIHDLELAAIALQDVRFPDGRPPPEGSDSEGRPRAGSKHSHCWAYIQNLCRVENCPYLHPVQAHYFIRHTPCLQWPNCNKGALCPYKHPEPIIPKVRTLPPLIEQPSMTAKPASPVERTLGGAVQYHGTTYFPLKPQFTPSPPAPAAPAPSTQIYEPQRRHESVARMGFAPYLSPPPWQQQMPPISPQIQYSTSYSSVSSMETPNFALDGPRFPPPVPPSFGLQPRTPPFYDGVIYSGRPPPQPAQPMHDSFQQMHRRVASIPRSTVPVPSSIMEQFQNMSVAEQPQTEQQEPFPYVPPTAQRPGHTRRVSVALRSKEDTDALGLFSSAPARQPWQTHGTRSAHRSWAPPSSSSPMTPLL